MGQVRHGAATTTPQSEQPYSDRRHPADITDACSFAGRVKTLNVLTSEDYIAKIWTSELGPSIVNPRLNN